MIPAPSFSQPDTWEHEQYVEDWRDTWDEEQFVHFVAEHDGRVVSHMLLYKRPHDSPRAKGLDRPRRRFHPA
jgi:hypothetical protein